MKFNSLSLKIYFVVPLLPWNYEVDIAQQPYKYNGHEYIEDFGLDTYDFGFRGYYAAIGRFTSIDPLAEGTYYQGCYNYANGNPVANIDFMGLFGSSGIGNNVYDPIDKGDITGLGDLSIGSWDSWQEMLNKLMGKGQGSLGGMLGGGGRLPNNFGDIFEGFLNGTVSGDVVYGIMMNGLYSFRFGIPVLWHDPPILLV